MPATKRAVGNTERILGRDLVDGVDLHGLLSQVALHYIHRALTQTGGNKSHAAKLIHLKNNHTIDIWLNTHTKYLYG